MTKLKTYAEAAEKLNRARNLIETMEGSLDYLPEWGVDKRILTGMDGKIPEQPVKSYITQKAYKHGIVMSQVSSIQADFVENLIMRVE